MSVVCTSCGLTAAGDAAFCSRCGAGLASACPRCGSPTAAEARFCSSCGHRLDAVPGEERKLVTAVFADLVGSTALGEEMDPELLRLVLSRYFDEMSAIVDRWGGSVAKYVGDAVLAIFGLPGAHGDDADRALLAALDMQHRLELLNDDLAAEYAVRLQSRTGIETGEVVASAADDVVLGDVMNTAARLEQAAAPGSILVGARTVANLTLAFELDEVAPIGAKGKTELVKAFRLLGRAAGPSVPGRQDLVGRERELGLLQAHLERVEDGAEPFLVTVVGDAGIGKSSLVAAFAEGAARGGATVLTAGCLPYGEGVASWPLRQIVHDLAGIELADDVPAAARKLAGAIAPVDEDGRILHALAVSAGITLTENPLERLPPEALRRELAHAWPALLTAMARSSPVVLIIEDLHWAEQNLLGVVDRIVTRTSGPLLVVCTSRPDPVVDAGFGPRTPRDRLAVAPLGPVEQSDLERRLLPGLAVEEVHDLLAVAGGNPFFMEEIAAHLVETGALRAVDGGYRRAGGVRPAAVPDTVRALLSARIDGLEPTAKRVLLAASVLGSSFWSEPLAGMAEVGDVEVALEVLEAADLIAPGTAMGGPGGRTYRFRHDLLQEVAYGSLSRARAARHHAHAAAWIEGRVGERRPEFDDLIAHHRAAAAEDRQLGWPDDRERAEALRSAAVDDLLEAAVRAVHRSQWAEALHLIDRAAPLAGSASETARIDLARARALRAGDRFDDAWRAYRQLIELTRTDELEGLHSDAVIEAAIMVAQMGGALREGSGWRAWLGELVETRLDDARRAGRLEEQAALQMVRGSLFFWGDGEVPVDEAHRAATDSVTLARRAGSIRVEAPALDLLAGYTLFGLGLGPAVELVDRILEVADRSPDRVVANELFTTAQWLLVAGGDLDRAEAVGRRHDSEATLLGTHTRIHALRGVVELGLGRGDLGAVLAGTTDLLALVDEDGGRVCDHGAVALSARALGLVEAGEEEGRDLFLRFGDYLNPDAVFTAHFGNLERRRPFLTPEEADRELSALGDPRTLYQEVARCWVAIPLALALGESGRFAREVDAGRRLAAVTNDSSLLALVAWAEAAKHAAQGRSGADAEVLAAIERLGAIGRGYAALRLGADAAAVASRPPAWAREWAARATRAGAHRTAADIELIAG